ncbi:hypothetical protein NDU88_004983 [Pleurodeles waltl]|uniref:Uncharacterized protein n=1 Tax=Pleurodeles waltl TaxID=8319 RepID=A0AAV7W956_PLEWA|nr:hypothetical protein NDU88_004983 [Pleurodeles waltl]
MSGEAQPPVTAGDRAVAAGARVQYVVEQMMETFNTNTSDLFWQEVAGRSCDDPGEYGATQGRREGGPQVASWIASPEEGMRPGRPRTLPGGGVTVEDMHPPASHFPGGQRSGTSGGYRGLMAAPAARSKDGEPGKWVSKGPVAWGQEVAGEDDGESRENSELDFGDESVNEGEISEGFGGRSRIGGWPANGGGAFNPVGQSF